MDLVIRNGISDTSYEPVEVGIEGGKIVSIAREGLPTANQEVDAEGGTISPAFLNPHFHLENALLWGDPINRSGTLEEAIELYAKVKREMPIEDIISRGTKALRLAMGYGTLWMRSHVDIDQISGLHILHGVTQLKRKFAGLMDIQLIAFPQLGMTRNPEAADYMWQAMENGADVVGGMPHAERDMEDAGRHIDLAFKIAQKYNADIDMHIDETDDPYWHSLELLAEKTIETGWQGRVTAGHCCSMSAWDDAMAERIIEKVKRADLHIVTNAPINLMVQGRGDHHPKRRGIPRVKELLEAGVTVSCGQDDVQNMFYPFGNMDMLEVAMITAHAAHLSSPQEIHAAFDMPRYAAARGRQLKDYGVHVGADANLVVLAAGSDIEALRQHPDRRYVIRQGKIMVETCTHQTWHVSAN